MNETNQTHFKNGVHFLAENGLNLFTSVTISSLPKTLQTQLIKNNIPLNNFTHLMMTGNGGHLFWTKLQDSKINKPDPVDNFSVQLTQQFIESYLENPPHLLLYPLTQFLIPLLQLGEWAGWSHPAPIGQGINPEFGVWFAYRTAFLANGRFPHTPQLKTESPCHTCLHKPCITTCPSAAVQPESFDIFTCADFRIEPKSTCADRCLARMACPIAPQHRYSLPQIQYHYTQSLETIKAYKRGDL